MSERRKPRKLSKAEETRIRLHAIGLLLFGRGDVFLKPTVSPAVPREDRE